jgi:two-component system response regulator NreC
MSKLRVLVADDHAVVREGLKSLVNAQPDMEVIAEAGNGREACRQAKDLMPDVIVLDLSMPEMDGAQATGVLKRLCPQTKVLVLTVHEDEDYLRLLLKKGASGYVLKRAAAEELAFAIRKVTDGGIYVDATLTEKLVSNQPRRAYSRQQGSAYALSEREIEVLRLLAWGHSHAEIAGQLHLSVRTVETYKARMMEKLNLRNRTDIIRYAVCRGWLKNA